MDERKNKKCELAHPPPREKGKLVGIQCYTGGLTPLNKIWHPELPVYVKTKTGYYHKYTFLSEAN